MARAERNRYTIEDALDFLTWNNAEYLITHHYVPSCSHMDKSDEFPWRWSIISEKQYPAGDDIEQSVKTEYVVITTAEDARPEDIRRVVADHFRRGCACDYDCCGHYHGGVVGDLEPAYRYRGCQAYRFYTSYSRNY